MRKLPILFSGPMVRAILREIEQPGTGKTQTRRVINFPGIENVLEFTPVATDNKGRRVYEMKNSAGQFVSRPAGKHFVEYHFWLPYAVGDRLYVREAWRAQEAFDDHSPSAIGEEFEEEYGEPWCPVFYEANKICDVSSIEIWQQSPPGRLRQGMHMPRWASRLTLIVTEVRVERLQDISETDAIAEGIVQHGRFFALVGADWDDAAVCARDAFSELWDSINGARPGYLWKANPWVAAYTFRPILENVDQIQHRTEATSADR